MMEIEDYKPNSYVSKSAAKTDAIDKKIEKIVTGPVKTKKKSEIHKVKDLFISEDASTVKNYILMDVLVPAVKKAIQDIVTDGIAMLLNGETGRRTSKGSNASYVSYNNYSSRDRDRFSESRTKSGYSYSYSDVILDTRIEAEKVLTRMDEIIDVYGVVSVGDLYDLVGVSGPYTDNKYGWTNIRNAEIVRVSDGFMLKLPKALPIN